MSKLNDTLLNLQYRDWRLFCFVITKVSDFDKNFKAILKAAEEWGKAQERITKPMRTFEESAKSKKTVSSLIEKKNDPAKDHKKKGTRLFEHV